MNQRAIDVAGTGFTVLDRIYADDQPRVEALGGSCGNVLISLAMLKHSVAPLLALGYDEAGEVLIGEFREAGADTSYISRSSEVRSPILAQHLDTHSGQHSFSFICPETNERLPKFKPIEMTDVQRAGDLLNGCSVFYSDRLTSSILEAMETASDAGAVVYFEPSDIGDVDLFKRALKLTSILKVSSDRIGNELHEFDLRDGAVTIVTHGRAGLQMRQDDRTKWCAAIPASVVKDTCGSGDMVTVGLINCLLGSNVRRDAFLSFDDLYLGVVAGQRLATANCAFPGARGLFSRLGVEFARRVLESADALAEMADSLAQMDLFEKSDEAPSSISTR